MWFTSTYERDGAASTTRTDPLQRDELYNLTVPAKARIWQPNTDDEIVHKLVLPDSSDGASGAALTWAISTNMTVFRQLQIVNGSYVTIISNGRTHVAKLVLNHASATAESQESVEEPLILSPLLAFNLGIQMYHDQSKVSTITVHLRGASSPELGLPRVSFSSHSRLRRQKEQKPATATHAVISPLLASSLSCRHHAQMEDAKGLVQSIRSFFSTPQVLQLGDVFAIPLSEMFPKDVSDAIAYSEIELPPSSFVTSENATRTVYLPPTNFSVDSAFLFFRVETLEGPLSSSMALSVSDSTELIQGNSVSHASPDEEIVQHFFQTLQKSSSTYPSSLLPSRYAKFHISNAFQKLYELLAPSRSSNLSTSVLLSGPHGVGKATLIHHAARRLGMVVLEVPFTDLTGQSELHVVENLREQVARAQAMAPCVLYLRRFFSVDSENEEGELRLGAALSECLHSLQTDTGNIPLLACVEDVADVPKFIRQSFLYELEVDTPDQDERYKFLKQLEDQVSFAKDVDLKEIAQVTAGRTFGELNALVSEAGSLVLDKIDLVDDIVDTFVDNWYEPGYSSCCISHELLLQAAKEQQTRLSSKQTGSTASIPNVKWEDVGGLDDVKDEVLDVVQLPLQHPELFASGVRQRSGILLYGPPGTGKTLLAKAIATECQLNFLSVKGPELLNMYIGESEKNVRQVFAQARRCKPCVLFFDELDSLAPMRGRGSDSGGVMDRVVSQLLTEIDGLSGGGQEDNVFVIGATNRPDLLETGLLRPGRFDRLLYLGISGSKEAQRKVLEAQTRKFTLAPDVDLDDVVRQCGETYTGADFYALSSGALSAALKDKVTEIDTRVATINAEDCYSSVPTSARMLLRQMTPDELRVEVGLQHFRAALESISPSVSTAELAHYETLRKQYSSRG